MRKRYYIIFVSREEDGRVKKIPIPLHYAYVFVAAAVVGAFTITGMAGSYTRMLLKTSHFNEIRSQREALRKDYLNLEQVAHEKDVQAASLGSLASEVSALYGLKQNKLNAAKQAATPAPALVSTADQLDDQDYHQSLDTFYMLRTSAMSGRVSRALEIGMGLRQGPEDWLTMADAPSLWPVVGKVTSSFGEREDPFNGEGAFHSGVDISANFGESIHAAADGTVESAEMANGYGREIIIDHGHGIRTVYGHLSGFAVTAGQQVTRGQVIGYVGLSGRSTGPHLHYEVRIQNTPVNPHKYLRSTMQQMATYGGGGGSSPGGS
jgi:murein DD-endopeptidase MepM/ murein hydrolase activator NlpD